MLLLVGLLMLSAGCASRPEDGPRRHVERWQRNMAQDRWERAYNQFDILYARRAYGDYQQYRVWAANVEYRGDMAAYTESDYASARLIRPGVWEIAMREGPRGTYTLFVVKEAGEGQWVISSIETGVRTAAH